MKDNLREIVTLDEFNQALNESNERPVLLFKHSLTCPISERAYREFQSHLEQADTGVSYNLIIVQKARPVSNEAASRLGVRHESPQALLVRNGRQVWNASHSAITTDTLAEAIRKNKN